MYNIMKMWRSHNIIYVNVRYWNICVSVFWFHSIFICVFFFFLWKQQVPEQKLLTIKRLFIINIFDCALTRFHHTQTRSFYSSSYLCNVWVAKKKKKKKKKKQMNSLIVCSKINKQEMSVFNRIYMYI